MPPLGADVEELHELAGSMRTASRRLEDIALGLDRRSRRTGWTGRDADRFAGEWSARHRPALLALSRRCTQQAAHLDAQVAEQRRASAATGGAVRSTPAVAPRTERRYVGGLDIKVAFLSATIEGDISILDVGGGRSRVTVTETGLVGVVGSVGSSASFNLGDENALSTPVSGAQADARARVGGVQRRSWVVDDADVDDLLAKIAVAEALERTSPVAQLSALGNDTTVIGGGTVGALRAVGGMFDAVAGLFGHDTDVDDHLEDLLTIPGTERTENLLEVEAAVRGGIAGFGSLAPVLHGGLEGTVRAGVGHEDGRRSTIVEMEGGAVGAFSTTLLGKVGASTSEPAVLAQAMRLELVERRSRDGLERLVFSLTQRSGSQLNETTFEVGLTARGSDELARGLRTVAGRLADGDLDGAIAELRRVPAAAGLTDRMSVSTATSDVSGHSLRASGSVGAGLTVGVTVRGQALEIQHHGSGSADR